MLFDDVWRITRAASRREGEVANHLRSALGSGDSAETLASTKAPWEGAKLYFAALAAAGLVELSDQPPPEDAGAIPTAYATPGWIWTDWKEGSNRFDLSI